MKLKSLFLTSMLSLLFISGAFAQDKFEYGVYRYFGSPSNKTYTLYFNSDTDNRKEAGKIENGGTGCEDITPLFKYLDGLTKDGWEVYNVTNANSCDFIYHLRKKKN